MVGGRRLVRQAISFGRRCAVIVCLAWHWVTSRRARRARQQEWAWPGGTSSGAARKAAAARAVATRRRWRRSSTTWAMASERVRRRAWRGGGRGARGRSFCSCACTSDAPPLYLLNTPACTPRGDTWSRGSHLHTSMMHTRPWIVLSHRPGDTVVRADLSRWGNVPSCTPGSIHFSRLRPVPH